MSLNEMIRDWELNGDVPESRELARMEKLIRALLREREATAPAIQSGDIYRLRDALDALDREQQIKQSANACEHMVAELSKYAKQQQPADVGYVFGGDARHYIQRLFDACGDGSGTLDAGWVMTVATKALEALYDRDEQNRPKIVCLCGSTRFWKTFQDENLRLTKEGVIVLSIGAATASDSEHLAKGVITAEQKEAFDKLHLAKVELADEILVLNVGGYIGESTSREIAHANKHRKRVVYLEQRKGER